MEYICNNIEILDEVLIDEVTEAPFKNYNILCDEVILEVGRCEVEDTINDILQKTGIVFNLSKWIINEN